MPCSLVSAVPQSRLPCSGPQPAPSSQVAPAFRFPGETMPTQPAPDYGADTEAVLRGLGYDEGRIADLRGKKVI